ncbi:MAG: polyphosphate kinase 1, partial [Bacteroidia bacterium]|nr:polyphosphate kinase 1 [Bacteroidia bacterium]
MPSSKYFDRDLSWLSFNFRVLMEATDRSLPLYERIKFLAIYSSNLDEFFRVRITSVRSLLGVKKRKRTDLEFSPEELYDAVFKEINRQQEVFGRIFQSQILPELQDNNVHLLQGVPTHPEHVAFIEQFFEDEVSPYMHPELLRRKRIRHFLRDNVLYLAIKLHSRSENSRRLFEESGDIEEKTRRAIILVPTQYLPRFIELPNIGNQRFIMFLDDVIRHNLPSIFIGYDVKASYTIKLNRNADLQIEDEFTGDLVEKIRKSLSRRQTGNPARFLYDHKMPEDMIRYMADAFSLTRGDLVAGGRYHNFHDFFSFPNPLYPKLERISTPPLRKKELDNFTTMAEAMSMQNWLLHFPYHSYDYVLRFLNGAATDPHVKSIRTTQYRVASNSAIVNSLIRAAQNGKDVTVFVELKARFDEQVNLKSAQEMEDAGVNIIYSLPGLKVHAKVALVEREEEGELVGYAFMSTGNFNEKTARIYADHGYFTKDETYIEDLKELFRHLADQSYEPQPFQRLLVAQFNLRKEFYRLIDREIYHVRTGGKGEIVIKLNNLEDRGMIDKLYEASQAGVNIHLLLRGICCLKPGLPGISERIVVTRIVDQFLEHARVFLFYNNGEEALYMGSADWMIRNLERRIEVV